MVAVHRAQVVRVAVAVVALAAAVGGESSVGRALAEGGVQRAAFTAPASGPLAAPGPAADVDAWESPVADVPQRAALLGLPAVLSADGSAVEVGYRDAPAVLTLFEDFRCSTTQGFESAQGRTLADLAAAHRVLIRYVLESSLDERLPGPGAQLATNAARAALAHGRFPLYHALLFANQPPEDVDGFTEGRLLELASAVPGLRSAAFDSEVHRLWYRQWVVRAQQAYDRAGVHFGTPSMLLDGREVDLGARPQLLTDPAALQSLVRSAAERG
ncbi:thioredoxin domain-containing protein [Streptacidiphilus sp. PB12-B1b]|uniref:DsbA family protein n=1 Tax=Streptacidiphilus sp. PB12-B1b TaxID=2705012 RepID=UPI0015FC58E6|nr:thioredoxin domain-containing protein [Streptacidiphilus sp. PB12-B1b]QMU75946.1 thioredoxin domain-containing protein [Streptacidiphilus sp. PB12-B1b]